MTSRWKQYTAAFKLQVIKAAEETNNCAAAREFSVNEKLMRDFVMRCILNNKAKFLLLKCVLSRISLPPNFDL